MGRADEGRLRELAASVAAAAGYDLEELVVVAAGRRRLVRIMIDSDHGVSLDAAADVSRALAAELDALDETDDNPMGPAPYTLEVTSPGIGRPLTEERHFRRARGRLLDLTLVDGSSVVGRVRRIQAVEGGASGVELLIDRDSRVVPLDQITRAKVEVEFHQMPASHAQILDADGFVDPARLVDVDDDEAVDDEAADDEAADDELDEFDSVEEFEASTPDSSAPDSASTDSDSTDSTSTDSTTEGLTR